MEHVKTTTRIALGLASILIGVAILLFALNARGAMMRIGVSGHIGPLDILILSGLVLPPIIVGLHTLILRPRCDPYWNDKAFRAIGVVQFVSVVTHIYQAMGSSGGIGLGYILTLMVIGGLSVSIIRRAPGGLDTSPPPFGGATPR